MCYTHQYAHYSAHCVNPDMCSKTKVPCVDWWHFTVSKWQDGRSWLLPQASMALIVLMINWKAKMKTVVRVNHRVLSYGFPVATSMNFWPFIKSWHGREVFCFSWEHSVHRLYKLKEFPHPLSVQLGVAGKTTGCEVVWCLGSAFSIAWQCWQGRTRPGYVL